MQTMVDTQSAVPVEACIESSGYDTSAFLPTGLGAYATQGVQWSMPFNISNPVLFYNKKIFVAAGLDPDKPPVSLEEMRADSEAIVNSGAAKYGLALDSGFDSGGGWYIEQWFAKAGEFYADNENGRTARATKVLYNNATGQSLLTLMQSMINDGLAVNVGDNSTSGFDNLLKLADTAEPAAMTIATSASIGPVITVLGSGQFPQITNEDVGVAAMPGPDGQARRAGRWRIVVGRRFRRRRSHGGVVGLHHLPHGGPAAEPVVVGNRVHPGANRRPDARSSQDHAGHRPALQGSLRPVAVVARHPDVVGPHRRAAARGSHGDGTRGGRDLRWRRRGHHLGHRCRQRRRPDRRLQLPQRLTPVR